MQTSTPEKTLPQYDKETADVAKDFAEIGEAVIDLQDTPQFVAFLKKANIPYDDLDPNYWHAVEAVSKSRAVQEALGIDESKVGLFRLVAGAPVALYSQFALHDDEEAFRTSGRHQILKSESDYHKVIVSDANTRLRDYAGEHASMNSHAFTALVAEAANRGIDAAYWAEGGELTKATVKGVRTELGFEQKLVAAGLDFRRGTNEEDRKGIDYVVTDVPIDIKSSLRKVLQEAPAGYDKAYYIKNGKAIYYPYDADSDYYNDTFIVKDDILATRATQTADDIAHMR